MPLLLLVGLLTSCHRGPEVLARVAGREISAADVDLRVREQRVENAYDVDREAALFQLLRAQTYAEILGRQGQLVGASTLHQEATRIEKETLMPAKLREIREIFPDQDSYERVYVLPVYVNRILYFGFYLPHPTLHQEAQRKLEALRQNYLSARARGKPVFLKLGQALGIEVLRGGIPAGGDGFFRPDGAPRLPLGTRPDDGGPPVPPQIRAAALPAGNSDVASTLRQALARLRVGDLTPVLAWQDGFSLMKLDSRASDGSARVEVASVKKRPFGVWLQEQMRGIPMECLDKSLCPGAKELLLTGNTHSHH